MKTKFKNGDVIAIRHITGVETVAIFNSFNSNGTMSIYVEYDVSEDELYFNCVDCDFFYYTDEIEYRLATDNEKENLYYHLFLYFTKDWDSTWDRHFNDSTYLDILDCLLYTFAINVNEKDSWGYPKFIQNIRNHIWDNCCKYLKIETYIPQTDSPDKLVSLDAVCKWLSKQAGQYSDEVADTIKNDIIPKLKKSIKI